MQEKPLLQNFTVTYNVLTEPVQF